MLRNCVVEKTSVRSTARKLVLPCRSSPLPGAPVMHRTSHSLAVLHSDSCVSFRRLTMYTPQLRNSNLQRLQRPQLFPERLAATAESWLHHLASRLLCRNKNTSHLRGRSSSQAC